MMDLPEMVRQIEELAGECEECCSLFGGADELIRSVKKLHVENAKLRKLLEVCLGDLGLELE